MAIIKFILLVIIVIAVGITFTLYKNNANLFQAPGLSERLSIFLTTNSASTSDDHPLIELRTPVFNLDADTLYKHLIVVVSRLGWDVVRHDSENLNVNIVVYSRFFLFEDDVSVQVVSLDMNRSSLNIQSASRVGRGDFAANSGHIQALVQKLKE
jgi:uncharacterized protein (DUF1499 family)